MPTRERAVERGTRLAIAQTRRLGAELRDARVRAGLSQAVIARRTGIARSTITRIEHGDIRNVSILIAGMISASVGLDLVVRTYPGGPPIRDAAQLGLLRRCRLRLGPGWIWRHEVPLGIPNDQRAWDAVARHEATGIVVNVEAETRVQDVQEMLRRLALKRRDGPGARILLVISDTRSNRSAARHYEDELRGELPCSARRALAALRVGSDPGADAMMLL